jgi:hypothetical protein
MKPSALLAAAACAAFIVSALPALAQQTVERPTPPTPPAEQQPRGEEGALTSAAESPLRDLNMIKDKTPPLLVEVSKAPYGHVAPKDCAAMHAQIAELDKVLGPDLDSPEFGKKGKGWMAEAADGALQVPFAGVVRHISGADKARQLQEREILSGYVRRAYLKGALSACELARDGKPVRAAAAQPRSRHPDRVVDAPSNRAALSTHQASVNTRDRVGSASAPAAQPAPAN